MIYIINYQITYRLIEKFDLLQKCAETNLKLVEINVLQSLYACIWLIEIRSTRFDMDCGEDCYNEGVYQYMLL